MTDPKRTSNPHPEIPVPPHQPRQGDGERHSGEPVPSPPRPEIPSQSPEPEIPAKPSRDLPWPDRERAQGG